MDMHRPDLRDEANVRKVIDAIPSHVGGIALDIGAKYGLYTDLLAAKFDQVLAIECDPANMTVLARESKAENVTLISQAIGVKDNAMVKLYRSTDPGGSSINEESPRFGGWGHSWDNYVWVPTITLDTLWKNNKVYDKPFRFIKCDVEGAEDFIFEQGKTLLKENTLTMVLECHQPVNFERLYNLFRECGYQVYNINGTISDHLTYDCHFVISNEGYGA